VVVARGPVVVGMLGCGTVGGGVVRLLADHGAQIRERLGVPLVVRRIAVRKKGKPRDVRLARGVLTDDPDDVLLDPSIQVVVELVGGVGPALALAMRAVRAGKHLVTANKAMLALHGEELFAAARAGGVTVAFEGSVGGGIPVIRVIREGLVANRIVRIQGIINGTSNYILTEMTDRGAPYARALAEAQQKGYAEADPTLDVEGGDSAHKLAVLAACAWGVRVDPERIPTEGISGLDVQDVASAGRLGFVVKSLGVAVLGPAGLWIRVQPTLVPRRHVLASVSGAFNAIAIEGDPVGPLLLYGRGAGAGPTASAVVGDLLEVGRDLVSGGVGRVPLPFTPGAADPPRLAPPDTFRSAFYLRFVAFDRPGVLARIAGALGARGVSIASVVQTERGAGRAVPILVLTHECDERSVRAAVARIDRLHDVVAAPAVVLHCEAPVGAAGASGASGASA
jgi:homoserine dehydrogenase